MFRDNAASYNIVKEPRFKDFIYYVCWGEWRKRQLLGEGIAEKQIWVSGAMQLDFFRTEFMKAG